MVKFDKTLIPDLLIKARNSKRRRFIYKLHSSDESMLHVMINVILKDSYIQPHKHELLYNGDLIKKGESYLLLHGEANLELINDEGGIIETIFLSARNQDVFFVPEGVWHTIKPLTDYIVIYENKNGPYIDGYDKVFHPNFPKEDY